MGRRGPDKQYDVSMRITITHRMDAFLDSMALVIDCSKQEVVRMIVEEMFDVLFAHREEMT